MASLFLFSLRNDNYYKTTKGLFLYYSIQQPEQLFDDRQLLKFTVDLRQNRFFFLVEPIAFVAAKLFHCRSIETTCVHHLFLQNMLKKSLLTVLLPLWLPYVRTSHSPETYRADLLSFYIIQHYSYRIYACFSIRFVVSLRKYL